MAPTVGTCILREGLRLPALNPGLFSVVFALAVANATVSVLTYSVIILPLVTSILHDFGALWDADPASFEHADLVKDMGISVWELMPAAATYVLASAVMGSIVWVIEAFAAVAVCSGKVPKTFGEFVHRAMGPFMAAALANIAASACVGAIMVSALATVFLQECLPALVFMDLLIICAAYAGHRYIDFVCAVGVIVATEEPGCHGVIPTLRRAWRLTTLELAEAVSFILRMPAVSGAASPFFVVAAASAPTNAAWRALLGSVYVLLSGAVQVLSVCAVTVFYHECRLRCKEVASAKSDEANV